jgi:DNA-binding Lrp family transcriptional regulator
MRFDPAQAAEFCRGPVSEAFPAGSDSRSMDALDLEIYLRMHRGGRWVWWGIDPRISVQEIATELGVRRGTVSARILRWKKDGFLLGSHAAPSLQAFGCGVLATEYTVANSREAEQMLDRLDLVDGIIHASTFCGEFQDYTTINGLSVQFVEDHPRAVERRVRLLRELFPPQKPSEPVRLIPPSAPPKLSLLDWRILGSFVEKPDLGLGGRATSLKVTAKTLSRRLDSLVEAGLLDFALSLDWTKSPTVAIAIFYDPEHLPRILNTMRSRFGSFLAMPDTNVPPMMQGVETRPCRYMLTVVLVSGPNEVYRVIDELKATPGIVDARPDYWGPDRFYSGWFVQRISDKLASF